MSFFYHGDLKYYSFDTFSSEILCQGIFSRRGGVSPKPWNSLNCGGRNGDTRDNVVENRRRIFSAFHLPVESIYDVWQVHSTTIICTDKPRKLNEPHVQADAILTDSDSITLFMRFGDCVPLFFHDPKKHVIGIGHAGWKGTVDQIGKMIVEKMEDYYCCNRSDIQVGIGPSIGPDHYEVGKDVFDQFKDVFGSRMDEISIENHQKPHLDLWKANEILLRQSGVDQIEISGICTGCHIDDWYSHRVEKGQTGRFGALLAFRGN